jgi:carbonic anhydrase/acetyltransferase-like protein (isoleucine patch superfamily)
MPVFTLGARSPKVPAKGTFWIAPTASVIGDVDIAPGVSVWFGSVLRGDNEPISIAEDSNVQDGCILHTDPDIPLRIGRGVTVGHNAVLHGCVIADNSLIGMGSVILNGASIGRNCLIGAGTLVTERTAIPDNSVVIGSPGKFVRETSVDEIENIRRSAEVYGLKWRRYKADLVPI